MPNMIGDMFAALVLFAFFLLPLLARRLRHKLDSFAGPEVGTSGGYRGSGHRPRR
jgi:hypothetical protein